MVFATLVLFFFAPSLRSQSFVIWSTPTAQCLGWQGSQILTGVIMPMPLIDTYSWTIISPADCAPVATFSCDPSLFPLCDTIRFNVNCCGTYTVAAFAMYNNTVVTTDTAYPKIICTSQLTTSATPTIVCSGQNTSLTVTGASSYTWNGSGSWTTTGIQAVVNPTANSIYTVTGMGINNCPVSQTVMAQVQGIPLSVTPSSQGRCPGTQACFTAFQSPDTLGLYVPGPSTVSLIWHDPSGSQIANSYSICDTAVFGAYSVTVLHTGAAGTCATSAAAYRFNSLSLKHRSCFHLSFV